MPKTRSMTKRANRYAPYVAAARKVGGAAVRAAGRWAWKKMTSRRTQQRRLNVNISPQGNGSSQSFYKKTRKAKLVGRILKAMQPPRTLVNVDSQRATATAYGKQVAQSVEFIQANDITNMFSQLTTGGSNTQRLYIDKFTSEFLFSNLDSNNVFIRLYECTARRDFYSTTASTGDYSKAIWTPLGSFDQGLVDVSGSSTNAANELGNHPFMSRLFTEMWKIDKVYHIELGAGRSHKHVSSFDIKKFVNEPRSSRNSMLGGITRGILIIAYGAPVVDGTTNTLVSTSKAFIGWVRKDSTRIRTVDPQGEQIYRTEGAAISTVTTGYHIDDGGSRQAEVQA